MKIDYPHGLQQLRELVTQYKPELLTEFSLMETRLYEILDAEKRYGEFKPGEKNRLLEQFIIFTTSAFGLNFLDLCRPSEHISTSNETQNTRREAHLWQPGEILNIKETPYQITNGTITQWNKDQSVVLQCALAKRVDQSRGFVWIKQMQILQASQMAHLWQKALEKEYQLLQRLAHEARGFALPRPLIWEHREAVATLLQTSPGNQSWKTTFGHTDTPPDRPTSYALLKSARNVCQQLHLLHSEGFIHRNLSPQAILWRKQGSTIRDLGLSTWPYRPDEGPDDYRAPEQQINNPVPAVPGPYTDVYQMGMILYELLTTKRPNPNETPEPVRARNMNISADIDHLLQRALQIQTRDRWQTMAEFSYCLGDALLRP